MVKLKEYIYPEMNILFLALNAPHQSNENEKLFSGSLSYWNKLYKAGLITESISNPLEGEEKVFASAHINYKKRVYGMTDLNREVVQTKSTNVSTTQVQVERIIQIINTKKVDKLCIMHSRVAKRFEKYGLIKRFSGNELYGYGKVGAYRGTVIYEVPFHCASVPGIAEIYKCLLK